MKAYHIFLLRHGATQGNERGRYIGRTDMPLSATGVAQIKKLRETYEYPAVDALFSSPLTRCVRTARLLYPELEPVVIDGLAECDFGEFEGKTIDELKVLPAYKRWVTGMHEGDVEIAPPGGESSVDFQTRTCQAFGSIVERLLRSGMTRAAVVAHGGTISTILGTFALPRRPFYEWLSDNGCGYELLITPQMWMNSRVFEAAGVVPSNPSGEKDDRDTRRFIAESEG